MAKIDCLFVHVPQVREHGLKRVKLFVNFIAMGVFSMCNELYKFNFHPQIIHLGVEKTFNIDFAAYIKKNKIKFVGLSLHWHYQTYDTLKIAQKIKQINPDTFIFLGGIMASAFADDILRNFSFIDAVIKGEGEKSVVELAKKIHSDDDDLSSVVNLHWRKNNKIIGNKKNWFASEEELNSYSFDGLKFLKNYQRYLKFPLLFNYNFEKPEEISYDSPKMLVCCLGRGCPGNCTWCGGGFEATKKITGRDRVVLRNPKIVAKEFIKLRKKYEINSYYICFDPFPSNQEYLFELFDILGKKLPKKINILFECFGLPSKKFIDSFKNNLSEDSEIIISPEFGNEDLRSEHRAFSFSNKDLLDCIKYLIEKKIKGTLYFANLPFETKEQVQETRDFINNIRQEIEYNENIKIYNQNIFDVEPYSPWALNPEKYGIELQLKTIDDYLKNSKNMRDLL